MLGHCLIILSCVLIPTIAGSSSDGGKCTCINEKYSLAFSYVILFEQNLEDYVSKEMVKERFNIFGKNGEDDYSKSLRIMDNIDEGDFVQSVVDFRKAFCEKFKGDIQISDTLKDIYSGGTFSMTNFLYRKFSGNSLKSGVVADLLAAASLVIRTTSTGESSNTLVNELREAGGNVDNFEKVVNCIKKLVAGQTVTEEGIWDDLDHSKSILGDKLNA